MTTKLKAANLNATYSADQFLKTSAAGALSWGAIAAGGGLAGVQSYTSTGSATWTKSTRESALGVTITKLIVHVQGAGGGSADSSASTGVSGGAGGGYACKLIDVTNIDTCTVTVGAGTSGSAGGNSTFEKDTGTGTFLIVTGSGGSAGVASVGGSSPVAGGAASNGDVEIPGGPGAGLNANDGNQWGGDSFMGFGGRPLYTGDPRSQQGSGFGAGASGCGWSMGAGKAGNDGAIFVYEYQ